MPVLEIHNFGPLKSFKMEIKQYNILIGEQATGKSTVAKSIYFFRMIQQTITNYMFEVSETGQYKGKVPTRGCAIAIKTELKWDFVDIFGPSWNMDPDMLLSYTYAPGISIEARLENTSKYIKIDYSEDLLKRISAINLLAKSIYKAQGQELNSLEDAKRIREENRRTLRDKIEAVFEDTTTTYYIPAGRSILTLLSQTGSISRDSGLDRITSEFINTINLVKNRFSDGINHVQERLGLERTLQAQMIAQTILKQLKGDYIWSGNGEYIKVADGSGEERVKINYASSGQQEVVWLYNLLYILMLQKERCFMIIEEPEAHLYPTLTCDVIKYISLFCNITGSSVLITTHSPYAITTVNMLYIAGRAEKETKASPKDVQEVIGGNYEIIPSGFSGYRLQRNGSEKNALYNRELKELNTSLIDEASEEINDEYQELYYRFFVSPNETDDS